MASPTLGVLTREEIAKIIWETWIRNHDDHSQWSDAFLYAPEDAAGIEKCADAILRLLSVPSVLPEGWRPIESAPKDGTRVIAVQDGLEPEIQYWHVRVGWVNDGDHYRDPTHWKPLPPPPVSAAPLGDEGNQGLAVSQGRADDLCGDAQERAAGGEAS